MPNFKRRERERQKKGKEKGPVRMGARGNGI
jgi:hypothetical protein